MPYIIYPQQPDNKLAVLIPCTGATKNVEITEEVPVLDENGEPTIETTTQTRTEEVVLTIQDIAVKDVPEGVPYAIVDSLEGIDNDYFDGFIYSEGEAVPDIAACKGIHLDKFRAARAPKLAALDVDFMRAVEQGDTAKQAEIAASKQALRDVTLTPLPDTLPEIKEVWPEILN